MMNTQLNYGHYKSVPLYYYYPFTSVICLQKTSLNNHHPHMFKLKIALIVGCSFIVNLFYEGYQ